MQMKLPRARFSMLVAILRKPGSPVILERMWVIPSRENRLSIFLVWHDPGGMSSVLNGAGNLFDFENLPMINYEAALVLFAK